MHRHRQHCEQDDQQPKCMAPSNVAMRRGYEFVRVMNSDRPAFRQQLIAAYVVASALHQNFWNRPGETTPITHGHRRRLKSRLKRSLRGQASMQA